MTCSNELRIGPGRMIYKYICFFIHSKNVWADQTEVEAIIGGKPFD